MNSGRGAVQNALGRRPTVGIVAGGGRDLRVIAEVLQDSVTPSVLRPAGTGDLWARILELRRGYIDASARAAFNGVGRRVDVGCAELDDEADQYPLEKSIVSAALSGRSRVPARPGRTPSSWATVGRSPGACSSCRPPR